MKIDIEAGDLFCLKDLDPRSLPHFISVESECGGSDHPLTTAEFLMTIRVLYDLGYRSFKLVNQYTLTPVTTASQGISLAQELIDEARRKLCAYHNWHFPIESSGPWGDDLPGPWMTYEQAVQLYCSVRKSFFEAPRALFSFWFDWHATTRS